MVIIHHRAMVTRCYRCDVRHRPMSSHIQHRRPSVRRHRPMSNTGVRYRSTSADGEHLWRTFPDIRYRPYQHGINIAVIYVQCSILLETYGQTLSRATSLPVLLSVLTSADSHPEALPRHVVGCRWHHGCQLPPYAVNGIKGSLLCRWSAAFK